MFFPMQASPFASDAALGSRRPIIRRNPDNAQEIEMVDAAWGLAPIERGEKPFKFIRSEGRSFPLMRCLVPASEFHVRNDGRRFRVTLDDGNFFYLAGVWRPAEADWPLSYAVVTIEANTDVMVYQERQGAVLLRRQNMAWLDSLVPEHELLQPLPPRSFRVEEIAPRVPIREQLTLAL
ncbi:SOS response-associated peptidase family protein [Sphingomonas leidyi]|jgi:putative SOS response-associated peptidase YedK